jgi:hypothetical protein
MSLHSRVGAAEFRDLVALARRFDMRLNELKKKCPFLKYAEREY